MPYPPRVWAAIAADYRRKYGPKKAKAKLRELKSHD